MIISKLRIVVMFVDNENLDHHCFCFITLVGNENLEIIVLFYLLRMKSIKVFLPSELYEWLFFR